MFIRSLNLNLKDRSTRRILIIIGMALIVAVFLIVVASASMLDTSNKIKNDYDFFSLRSYHSKSKVKVISNKNNNDYEIEEFYLNANEGEKYKIITSQDNENKMEYIINNNSLIIRNENQKSEYLLSDFVVKKDNLLSLSTFIQICNDITLSKNTLDTKCVKLENIACDNLIRYKITFSPDEGDMHECSMCEKYKDILKNGINVSKLELVYDNVSKRPVQYIVYSRDNQAIIDMEILEFNINDNFDEKIFAF